MTKRERCANVYAKSSEYSKNSATTLRKPISGDRFWNTFTDLRGRAGPAAQIG
jgi:hypothetical protein